MKIEEINLKLIQAEAFNTREDLPSNGGIRLWWTSDIGQGCYDLIINEGEPWDVFNEGNIERDLRISGYSEHMDNNEIKKFIKELARQFIGKIYVID